MNKAKEDNVEPEYITHAEKLLGQMQGNIKARETLQMLIDYPQREYPENEELDPKNKKKVPAKKKKKKDTFPTPEWAEDLTAVTDKVKLMNELVADRVNLKLNDEFLGKVKEEMDRFKKEISFRR